MLFHIDVQSAHTCPLLLQLAVRCPERVFIDAGDISSFTLFVIVARGLVRLGAVLWRCASVRTTVGGLSVFIPCPLFVIGRRGAINTRAPDSAPISISETAMLNSIRDQ